MGCGLEDYLCPNMTWFFQKILSKQLFVFLMNQCFPQIYTSQILPVFIRSNATTDFALKQLNFFSSIISFMHTMEFLKMWRRPDQCGSVGWASIPQSKSSLVRFPVRAHVWVIGSVPGQGAFKRQPIDVSHINVSLPLSPFLSLSLKLNKEINGKWHIVCLPQIKDILLFFFSIWRLWKDTLYFLRVNISTLTDILF